VPASRHAAFHAERASAAHKLCLLLRIVRVAGGVVREACKDAFALLQQRKTGPAGSQQSDQIKLNQTKSNQ